MPPAPAPIESIDATENGVFRTLTFNDHKVECVSCGYVMSLALSHPVDGSDKAEWNDAGKCPRCAGPFRGDGNGSAQRA